RRRQISRPRSCGGGGASGGYWSSGEGGALCAMIGCEASVWARRWAFASLAAEMPRVLIVGAGLTGCTLGWRLAQEGVETVLLERADVPGGLIRSEHMEGVLYEPHGSHIFHTEDKEVWDLATSM